MTESKLNNIDCDLESRLLHFRCFFFSVFISYRVKGWMGAQKGHKVTSYDLFQ